MVKLHYIIDKEHSKEVVHSLLCSEKIIAVAAKQVVLEKPGDLVLIQIATPSEHAYLFDIRKENGIMHEGELWRLLVAPAVTKVIHDCRNLSAALRKQFNVQMNNVFDTQAAYCVLMIHHGLPPRHIPYQHLYAKYGDSMLEHQSSLQSSLSVHAFDWAQRPLSKTRLEIACADAVSLLSDTYSNIRREMSDLAMQQMEELTHAYIHGKFKDYTMSKSKKVPQESECLKLTKSRSQFLDGTLPQGTRAHIL